MTPSAYRPTPAFTEPLPHGYLYLGTSVDPRRRGPFVRPSAQRAAVLERYKSLARQLTALDEVVNATVYETVLMPPLPAIPQFDVITLVETTSPEALTHVHAAPPCSDLDTDLTLTARNIKRFGDTDNDPTATFLFNHFTADDGQVAADVWPTLAGWFADHTGIDNSTALQPTGQTPYALINYARIPDGPVRFLLSQFTKPSFYRAVRARLRNNNMTSLPLFCKPA